MQTEGEEKTKEPKHVMCFPFYTFPATHGKEEASHCLHAYQYLVATCGRKTLLQLSGFGSVAKKCETNCEYFGRQQYASDSRLCEELDERAFVNDDEATSQLVTCDYEEGQDDRCAGERKKGKEKKGH